MIKNKYQCVKCSSKFMITSYGKDLDIEKVLFNCKKEGCDGDLILATCYLMGKGDV